MTERSVTHASFSLERSYDASPARAFAAWADPIAKVRWFAGPDDWESSGYELDFRVGGHEHASGGPEGGPIHTYDARYYDIVPNQRIVCSYEMRIDAIRVSVSLATVEFGPADAGTHLIYTEQGVFLDGYEDPSERERGTAELLDALGDELGRTRAGA